MTDAQKMVRHGERLWTLCKRASVSNDADGRRDELISEFAEACTEARMIAERKWRTDWTRVQMAIVDFHSAAVHADEGSSGTFVPLGGVLALVRSLHSLGAVLGYVLSDAATADIDHDDEAAMAAVENQEVRHAAE